MFFVKYGNEYIHDPRKDLFLTAANPEVELNASGSFTFTMQYNNPLYDKLVERDTKNPITVWQDDELIFIGDIINIESGFKKYKEVECRGILGWLNDTIVRPYSTLESENDNVAPDGIAGYFEWLINNHNSQVEDTKKFKIDKNEGQSLDSKIYRSDSSYTNTGELIKNKILDEVGGYVIPKEENGEHVIDLIREIPEDNSQLIDFGKNLLDYVSSEDTDGMYTFVIPTGVMAEKESDNSEKATHNITIGERTVTDLTRAMKNRKVECEEAQNNSSTTEEDLKAAKEAYESAEAALEDAKVYTLDREVEEGYFKQGDIIYSKAAVKQYGWIGCPVAFDNTTLVSELIRNGVLALKGMESPVRTIEVKAVDLSMIKPNYSPIRVGQYVRVRSKPHNFDSYMLCSKIAYDLNQPDQNTFTLGQTYDVLTGIQNKKIKALNDSVNHVYSSAERISDEAKAIADATKKNEEEINNVREALANMNVDVWYAKSTSSSEAPTTGWQTIAPEWEDGCYIWTKTITTLPSGSTKESNPACITGNTGTGVSSITEEYYMSNSSEKLEGGSWVSEPPAWISGKYIWTRSKITYSNSKLPTYTTAICDSSWEALDTANTANTNASNAVTKAEEANTNASNAVTKAEEANTNASNAVTKAEEANTNVSNAVTKAEEAGKTATNYMDFIEGEGLIVGDRRSGTVGKNVRIDSDSVDIRNGSDVLASFAAGTRNYTSWDGATTSIYYASVDSKNNTEFGTHKNFGTEQYGFAYNRNVVKGDTSNQEASTELIAYVANPNSSSGNIEGSVRVDVVGCSGDANEDPEVSKRNKSIVSINGTHVDINASSTHSEGGIALNGGYIELTGDVAINGNSLADQVIAEGSSGIWRYRKWANGVAECWGGMKFDNLDITGVYGNLYYLSMSEVILPFTFAAINNVVASSYATSGLFGISIKDVTNSSIKYFIYSAKSESGKTMYVEFHVSGRWK